MTLLEGIRRLATGSHVEDKWENIRNGEGPALLEYCVDDEKVRLTSL